MESSEGRSPWGAQGTCSSSRALGARARPLMAAWAERPQKWISGLSLLHVTRSLGVKDAIPLWRILAAVTCLSRAPGAATSVTDMKSRCSRASPLSPKASERDLSGLSPPALNFPCSCPAPGLDPLSQDEPSAHRKVRKFTLYFTTGCLPS